MLVAQDHRPVSLLGPVNRLHPLNRGLVAWFLTLPGLSGGLKWHNLMDLSNGPHGTLTSMDPPTDWVSAKARPGGFGALDFDGSNDDVRFTFPIAIANVPITASAWVYPTNLTGRFSWLSSNVSANCFEVGN